jgi:uncharacterized protein
METLIENHKRLQNNITHIYQRSFYKKFKINLRLTGIIGARGVGKTTFLLNLLKEKYNNNQALYVSADHIYFSQNTLVALADQFTKEFDGKLLVIDEIHRYPNWNQELKNIYDSYPKLQIIFSGSSSLDLLKGKYDLSRRAIIHQMSGLSFREFLETQIKKPLPILSIKNLTSKSAKKNQIIDEIASIPKLLGFFKKYLRQGYYPTSLTIAKENIYHETLLNVIDKTIFTDISSFYNLKTQNLIALKKILYFFATSNPGELNINKIAHSLRKDHSTIQNYLQFLHDAGLLNFLCKAKSGNALIRSPEKIYLANSNLLCAINSAVGIELLIGLLRETFVVNQLQDAGLSVFYTPKGDIQCEKFIFEVGGKSKGLDQIQGQYKSWLVKDNILYATQDSLPLYLFGFLY